MNSEERACLYGLCAEIAVEERLHKLTHLVIELNLLLARYTQTLDDEATLSSRSDGRIRLSGKIIAKH
jgi:hypothetical protein